MHQPTHSRTHPSTHSPTHSPSYPPTHPPTYPHKVVEARNNLDGVTYAIKLVTLKETVDTATAEKVLREVTALASLDHPNVVRYNSAWLE
jgi:serine/threonine protein kinase